MSALDIQVGGEHYKTAKIQPVQYIEANGLLFLEGCVIKRVTRHDKPTGKGRQDIEKAIHELQLLLELRYGEQSEEEVRASALAMVENALRHAYIGMPAAFAAVADEITGKTAPAAKLDNYEEWYCPDCRLKQYKAGTVVQHNHAPSCSVSNRPEEPAAQIDDESDRQQAVQQNGSDDTVYDDPWYDAPEWARFKAQDQSGEWWWYEDRPDRSARMWVAVAEEVPGSAGGAMVAAAGAQNPNWRDTLIERTSGQDPQE